MISYFWLYIIDAIAWYLGIKVSSLVLAFSTFQCANLTFDLVKGFGEELLSFLNPEITLLNTFDICELSRVLSLYLISKVPFLSLTLVKDIISK